MLCSKKEEKEVRNKDMALKEMDMDGTEKQVSGGRTPLELTVGKKVEVALRGGGKYKTVDATDFSTGETMVGVKLENAEIIVCNPDDPSEIYALSGNIAPNGTTYGRSILALLERRDDAFWLKDGLLNKIGYLGKVDKESKKKVENKMEFLTWDPEVDKKGKEIFLKGDLPLETVGADQISSAGVEEGGEAEF